MEGLVKKAEAHFTNGYNCAQAVFAAYAPSMGIAYDDALRITAGMGGGMGRLQEVCGAVSAAFLLIGCQFGGTDPADTTAKDFTNAQVQEFARRFRMLHGSIHCKDLLGCDINTEEGRKKHTELNQRETVCAQCVHDAATLLEAMLPIPSAQPSSLQPGQNRP